MTNLDLLAGALAHTTGQPVAKWRRVWQRAAQHDPVMRRNLRTECADGERRLEELKAEAPGILSWLLRGEGIARQLKEELRP